MEKKILATIEEAVHNGDTAGANVLVIKDGKESAYCGYGMRDIENRLPIERDTIFRLYSQTKPITAAAAVSLMDSTRAPGFRTTCPNTPYRMCGAMGSASRRTSISQSATC